MAKGSGSLAKASESFATGGRPIDSKFKCVGLVYNDTRLVVMTRLLSQQAFLSGKWAGENVRIIGERVRIIGGQVGSRN